MSAATGAGGAHAATAPILFVTLSLDVGGAERQIAAVASELVRRGWPVGVYCFNREGVLAASVREAGVRVVPPPVAAEGRGTTRLRRAMLSLKAAGRLYRLLRQEKPPIVHFFLTEPYVFGAPAAIAAGTPVRIMSRREINPGEGRLRQIRRIEAVLHPRMSAIVGNSRHVIRDLQGERAPADRLGLIHNGVDLAAFAVPSDRALVRRELGIADDTVVLVKIANLVGYKGHADLLAALARIEPGLRGRTVLLLAGRNDGSEAALRQQAESLGIAGQVRFLGLRHDVPRILAASDIGVHASHMEGFANAVLEEMTAGLPVVATDVGGTPDAVIDGVQGVLVPAKAPEALASALSALIRDGERRRSMGAAARQRIVEEFAMPAAVDRYEALYRGLLAGRRPAEIAGVGLAQQPREAMSASAAAGSRRPS